MRPMRVAGGVLGIVALLWSAAAAQHVHGAGGKTPAPMRPMKAHSGPLPPMPGVAFEPPRPLEVITAVYEFAARHPEVLQYVPCYCGCERDGHNGNHDCFVATRSATGHVREWNTHGIGCAICIDVARDAMQLFKAGSTPREIRTAIDAKYRPNAISSTPTPQPR